MSQALTRYNALYQSIQSRRRKPDVLLGIDAYWAQFVMRAKTRRISRAWLRRQAEMIDALAPDLRTYSDAALDEHVSTLRETFVRGRQTLESERHAFAAVREVARRVTGEEAYIVQLMGAMALYHNRIVEMVTGEGKTLTGSLAAPLLAWRHKHLHIFTVNDYLASRDAVSRRPIYTRCLCDVGAITQEMDEPDRFRTYALPIVYGTPKQITADYLRDQIRLGQMNSAWAGRTTLGSSGLGSIATGLPTGAAGAAVGGGNPMIPGLCSALVDEADAVLIDEGVVPLIIARSRREDEMAQIYRDARQIAEKLDLNADFKIELVNKRIELTRRGEHRCTQLFENYTDPIWRATRRGLELIRQALVAKHCYLRGHQYDIVDGRIVIVDEYTGRFLPDRSWEHGLHQQVEAKENLDVTADRETLARISFQRFFRMYPILSGMTGTAADASNEMERVYQRPVTVIPTNRPVARKVWPTRIFRSSESRWNAVIESIQHFHSQGRPILVGTRSIEASLLVSQRLTARSLEHHVLNATFDKDEAQIVSLAGKHATITVATNMAGRGTDIKLDREAQAAGGLHVILTEMHSAKRIDRQFIGRAGRQGDPGSSQIFTSLEDELLRHYAPKLAVALKRFTIGSDELRGSLLPIARRLMRQAQRRAEAKARRSRADVLRHDDWIEKNLPGM